MTAVSPAPTSFSPSHSRTNSGKGDWKFSVPIDGGENPELFQNRPNHGVFPRNHALENPGAAPSAKSEIATPGSAVNGHPAVHDVSAYRVRSAGNSVDENRQNADYLAAPKGAAGSKRNSLVLVKGDGDPAFDLHGARTPAAGGGGDDLAGHGHNTSGDSAPYTNGSVLGKHGAISSMDAEESKWIHRDKLAQIEGNEAADYLYDVRKSQWIHKDKLERIEIEELQRAGASLRHSQGDGSENGDGMPVASPVGSEESDRHSYSDDFEVDPHDLRTPEEQAMDSKAFRRNPSYSRIPLASVSPHPIPQQFLERTTPLPRSIVTPNGSDDGASPGLPILRKRSYSAGSAMVLEAGENALSGTPGTPSPATGIHNPKTRNASGTLGGPRRASGSRTGSLAGKQRTRSNPQLYHRPGTAASHATHHSVTPGSANKNPGGQPPWVLASYKPDPSLPQDQQIIPTLAKRLQQEQWERDGVYASVYDRELRPLKVLDDEDAEDGEGSKPKDEWPLKSPRLSDSPAPREKPEQVTDGGYRIVPNVNVKSATAMPDPPPQIQQMRIVDDGKAKKRKMCCCVIM